MMSSVFQKSVTKPRYVPKVVKHEEGIQRQICSYLRAQFPWVVFRSDYGAGLSMSHNQARIQASLQSARGWPDLFIYEPVTINGKHYCGLALELKAKGESVIMKIGPRKGRLSTDKHIQEQAVILKALISKGYYANFAVGFDEAVKIINWYLGKKDNASFF